jgi:AcrR family transcriptional regulator
MRTVSKTRRQVIFEQAAILFRKKGYLSTSMRDLAQAVGIEPSSLYSHIESKEEILKKICFDAAEKFLLGLSEIKKQPISNQEKVRQLIGLHVEIAIKSPTSITLFDDEWRHLTDPFLSDFLIMRKTYEKGYKQILQAGIDKGEFKQKNVDIIFNTILSGTQWIHWNDKHFTMDDIPRVRNEISDIVLLGLTE